MIGAVIFVIFFLAFLAITTGMPTLPPGDIIQQQILQVPPSSYSILGILGWVLINGIINGFIYGFLIWLIFLLISMATGKGKKGPQSQMVQQTVNVSVADKEKEAQTKKLVKNKCEICNLIFGTEVALKEHKLKMHKK